VHCRGCANELLDTNEAILWNLEFLDRPEGMDLSRSRGHAMLCLLGTQNAH